MKIKIFPTADCEREDGEEGIMKICGWNEHCCKEMNFVKKKKKFFQQKP